MFSSPPFLYLGNAGVSSASSPMWSFRESAAPPPLLTSLQQLAWALPFKACEAHVISAVS